MRDDKNGIIAVDACTSIPANINDFASDNKMQVLSGSNPSAVYWYMRTAFLAKVNVYQSRRTSKLLLFLY